MVSSDERALIRHCMDALREGLPGFQTRRPQLEMIGAVANALACGRSEDDGGTRGRNFALCEAGTGTGKTIAASVPALVMAKSRGKRLVISSSTIALQHQYSTKDIPTLQRLLPIDFTFAVAKGRRRYACTAKLFAVLEDARQTTLGLDGEHGDSPVDCDEAEPVERTLRELIELAQAFEGNDWNGDRDELKRPVSDDTWEQLTTDRQGCSGNRCPQFARCPFYAARQRLKEVDLIIANHDLVLASLQMDGRGVLPDAADTFYIFDEGHSLVAKVVEQFAAKHALQGGIEWLRGLADCVRDIVLGLHLDHDLYRDARTSCKDLSADLDDLSRALDRTGAFDEKPVRRFKNGIIPDWTRTPGINILSRGQRLQSTVALVREQMFEKGGSEPTMVSRLVSELGYFASKLENLVDTWTLMLADDAEQESPNARWIERTGDGTSHDYLVCASPISGADKLRRLLWNRASAAIVTSATLESCGSFGPYMRQAGLSVFPEVRTLTVDSPFDYRNKAKLIIPPMRSDPKEAKAHTDEIVELLPRIIHSRGTLVLFASGKQMREVHARLPPELQEATLMQGSMPKMAMLTRHKSAIEGGGRSILFGLSSLAEGVDLPGEACTHVIVAKLPFSVPDSPLEEARSEWITSLGRSPFVEIVLPAASIRLQQAVGRLLRTVNDHGTVTILDRRIITKRWGAALLKGLPDFTILVGKAANDAIARTCAPGFCA
ncbi:MAG: ATP-dependent DNA helicase DinG [Sterolibacteriaceae bacterium]|nr:ATP-dependent DNA helicase DinG [Sterolibacteriaceae bacterium]